jgi:hypothetical protein
MLSPDGRSIKVHSVPEEVKPLNGPSNKSFFLMYLHLQFTEDLVDEADIPPVDPRKGMISEQMLACKITSVSE